MTDCFRCGENDHLSYDCPSHTPVRQAPAPAPGLAPAPDITYTPPPFTAPPAAPHPPTGDYLAAKAALGMPVTSLLSRLLSVPCPWCGAGRRSYCKNPATGQRKIDMHEARYVAALCPLPPRAPLADLAARQVTEFRASRIVLP